jgi:adenine-specific DNA-methyltransferase
LNYIGSKWSLLPFIQNLLTTKQLTGGTFCDIFAGTTAVGQLAKKMGFRVISNDWQYYSYVLGRASISCSRFPTFEKLFEAYPEIAHFPVNEQPPLPEFEQAAAITRRMPLLRVIGWLNKLPGVGDGFIYNNFCMGGTCLDEFQRNYFSDENGKRCDAIRNCLDRWRDHALVTADEYFLLLASLLDALDRVANTASVYGAFLKHLKPVARKPITLTCPGVIESSHSHTVYCMDANVLVGQVECDVLYLDPPYNRRQYATNYHLLETVAMGDNPELSGKTGLRPYEHQRSKYCLKQEVEGAFSDLVRRARARHIILSYNNEGFLSASEIERIFSTRGRVEVQKLAYRRFRADKDGANRKYAADQVSEYLFYVKVENEAELAA